MSENNYNEMNVSGQGGAATEAAGGKQAAIPQNAYTMIMAVYVLYLAAFVTGGLTQLIGVIIAYVQRGQATTELESNHLRFQIRTFWIGLLYGLIGALLTFVLIGFLVLLAVAVWMIVRCVKGIIALNNNQPINNPASWLFG